MLPPNATPQEVALAAVSARIGGVPIPNRDLYNPDTCPAEILPWLAWALSVDEWDAAASEAEKRGVIRNSLYVHKHKGTLASLKRAIEPIGYTVNIVEWFNDTPAGAPYTFRLEVIVDGQPVSDTLYGQLLALVATYKNVRSHMISLNVKAQVRGAIYMGAACVSGVSTDVFPYAAGMLESTGHIYFGSAEQSFDTVTVYAYPPEPYLVLDGSWVLDGSYSLNGNI